MKEFLHTMIRVFDLEKSLAFYSMLGLKEVRRVQNEEYKFTLVFLKAPNSEALLELTYNWEQSKPYRTGRAFGHLEFSVENIYDYCAYLQSHNVTILRPPRDGYMAFIKSPDGISIELLQIGKRLVPMEPWASMKDSGTW